MAYQTLYLTYRPSTFEQVIGQDHIVAALTAALRKDQVAHAYLFTGPRGTGKTTIGRLLAKAVNCTGQVENFICNECSACQAINQGSSLDVIEIDAASNRGIDDIRALKERVMFPPQELKRKVYIIDEVHMLTTEAFNALLKTLEEPPEHALFILATTEPHKVPVTIQSRCQRLDFHRGNNQALIANMQRILEQEKIAVDEAALGIIAELSEGGYRDSLTLLERVLQEDQAVTADRVRELFGLGDEAMVQKLLQSLVSQDRAQTFAVLEQANNQGVNPPYLALSVVNAWRRLLYIKMGAVKVENAKQASLGEQLELNEIRQLVQYWQQAVIDSRRSPLPWLPLEIAAAKWLEQNKVALPTTVEPTAKLQQKPLEIKVETPARGADLTISSQQWAEINQILVKHNHSLSKLLSMAAVGKVVAGKLPIYLQYPFHKETLSQKVNFAALAKALEQVVGAVIVPEFVVGQAPTDAVRVAPAAVSAKPNGDLLQSVSDVFS